MANDSNKEGYPLNDTLTGRAHKVLGLGLISAVSVLAGGLAVAWWYRKTLTKLQNPIVVADLPKLESLQTESETLAQPSPDALQHDNPEP